MLVFIALVGLSLGVLSGVVEISFHADQLAAAPNRLLSLVTNEQTLESLRAQAVRLKRAVEQKIISDQDRQLELALHYAQTDANRLQDMIEDDPDNLDQLIPQSQLLADSLDRLQANSGHYSEATLARFTDQSAVTFDQARSALALLEEARQTHQNISTKLKEITELLAKYLPADSGSVAGSQTKSTPEPIAPSPIPLKF